MTHIGVPTSPGKGSSSRTHYPSDCLSFSSYYLSVVPRQTTLHFVHIISLSQVHAKRFHIQGKTFHMVNHVIQLFCKYNDGHFFHLGDLGLFVMHIDVHWQAIDQGDTPTDM